MSALGKRALVAYSDDEDDIKEEPKQTVKQSSKYQGSNPISEVINKGTPGSSESNPDLSTNQKLSKNAVGQVTGQKRKIAYSSLGLQENPVKFVLQKTFNSKDVEDEDLKFLEPAKQAKQEIKYDSVQGGKSFVLDAPREKLWKKGPAGASTWEPFYEKKMREIYKEKLQSAMYPTDPDGEPKEVSEVPQPSEIREIKQSSLTSFDPQAYLAAKSAQSASVASLANPLSSTFLTADQEQRLGRQAIDLAREESTNPQTHQPWKNRKQYGF